MCCGYFGQAGDEGWEDNMIIKYDSNDDGGATEHENESHLEHECFKHSKSRR